jgi:hypothetical protein
LVEMRWMGLVAVVLGACATESDEPGKLAAPDVALDRCREVGEAVCGRFAACGDRDLAGCLRYWEQTRCGVGNCVVEEYCEDPIALEVEDVDRCVAFAAATSCGDIGDSGRWNLVNWPTCGLD